MARTITIQFDDGTGHTYNNVPEDVTPDQIAERAQSEFSGKSIVNIDGGKKAKQEQPKPQQKTTTPEGYKKTEAAMQMERSLEQAKQQGFGGLAKGVAETAWTPLSGLWRSAVGGTEGLIGTLGGLMEGKNLDQSLQQGAGMVEKRMAGTYQPESGSGKLLTQGLGAAAQVPSEASGNVLGSIGSLVGPKTEMAMQSIGEVAPSIIGIGSALKSAAKKGALPVPTQTLKNEKQILANDAVKNDFVLNPAEAKPTIKNRALESIAGKEDLSKATSIKNQERANNFVKADVDIPENVPLTKETLNEARGVIDKKYYKPIENHPENFYVNKEYLDGVKQIGSDIGKLKKYLPDELVLLRDRLMGNGKSISPKEAVDEIRFARNQAQLYLKSTDAVQIKIGQEFLKAANLVEKKLIESNLIRTQETQLLAGYRVGREKMAKSYAIEDAMNNAGNVNATKLATALKQKDAPLTGNLKKLADYASQFPNSFKVQKEVDSHIPFRAKDVVFAGARPATREALTTKLAQNKLTKTPTQVKDKTGRNKAILQEALKAAAYRGLAPQEDK